MSFNRKQFLLVLTFSITSAVIFSQKVNIHVVLLKDTVSFGNLIPLRITLTNNTKTIQRLLFDKPKTSTGGPWRTSASVINVKTKISAQKYSSKGILSSQVYLEDQLKDKYYFLKPRKSLTKIYNLSDIAVFNTKGFELPRGTYEIQLYYSSIEHDSSLNSSNKVKVVIN